ncbi:hypothetical protein N8I77_008484 [Diaporthe amygdali]|uniref:Heterokaryon incompatibility domain-containing protein n=1 Tax=Phomopsis amygdali TaxID=1214568 RepID=A0AAD9W2L6_PHOAM|nr:hypothetical protein N8I77_008484 [Diaporthe amygdali]
MSGNENTSQTFGNISNGFLLRGESKSRDSVLMARAWLDNCVSRHRKCPKSVNRRLPTRILDIGFKSDDPVKLMTTSNMGPATYACLSHCWGKSNPLLLTQANLDSLHKGIQYRSLQETYIDAIELTRKLGIHYIWIDTLCIIQNSPGDWKTESSKMHEYYGNCFLCIAATSAADHDGGCRTRDLTIQHVGRGDDGWPYSVYARPLIPHINHSGMYPHERYFPLLTRAWVYQERRLSSRVLHVTDAELFFECSSTTHCECGGSDGGNNTTSAWTKAEETFFAAHRRVNQMPDGPLKGEHEWRAHIHAYSTLDLTKQSDRLPALSGLAQWTRLRRQQLGKDPGRYLAGCWESTLIDDLSWVVGHQLTRYEVDKDGGWRGIPGLFTAAGSDSNPSRTKPTEYVAPSWSWSSVLDRVNYAPFGHSEALCHIKNAHVEPATEGGDPYGQLKDGWLILRAKLRPSRWVTQKKFFNGFSTYLTDIAGTQQTLMGLKKDKGLQWWRDWRDGDGLRLDGDQRLHVMPLASRKIWSNSEGAEFHLQWMPGILTVTETAYLVLRLVEGGGGTEDPGVYERVGWASYSGVTGGPDFRGIEMGYLKLI